MEPQMEFQINYGHKSKSNGTIFAGSNNISILVKIFTQIHVIREQLISW